MMMDRLEQGSLIAIGDVEDAIAPIGKPTGTVNTDMGEGRHQIGSAVAAHPSFGRHKIEIPDRCPDARVGLLLGRQQQGPILWIRDRSEEHTSELQSLMRISYAVFCLKK